MQDIKCAIKDQNLNNDEALQLIKEFSEGCARNNINFYLEVTDKPSVDGLFENLHQVFSSGKDSQQMLAEFYSRVQNPKELVKEFGESLLQIARKIMMAKPEFKADIDNTLKARFADGLRDHYHQAMAREMINAVQGSYPSSKPTGFASKQFKPLQFYSKPCEPQLVPGTDGSLKPETDCNYCKDLGHLKCNCPKLKEKEARMAGHQSYNKSKKEN